MAASTPAGNRRWWIVHPGGVAQGDGSRSSSSAMISMPETPSTMQWCIFIATATPSPSSPSTNTMSHSGWS